MLAAFAKFTALGGGRRVILDILPDPNLRSNPWGDDPAAFKTAFRRIADKANSIIGSSRVRTAFTAHRSMSSNRYSAAQWGTGGFRLFWPGANYVDIAGVGGYPTAGGTNVGYHEAAINEMASAAGPGVPIIIAAGGAPNAPSEAAQIQYATALAESGRSAPSGGRGAMG